MDDLHVSCVTFSLKTDRKSKVSLQYQWVLYFNPNLFACEKKYEIHEDLVFASVSRL